jgi:hypothetical protein
MALCGNCVHSHHIYPARLVPYRLVLSLNTSTILQPLQTPLPTTYPHPPGTTVNPTMVESKDQSLGLRSTLLNLPTGRLIVSHRPVAWTVKTVRVVRRPQEKENKHTKLTHSIVW